ncbi:hypothetical protein M422DRAFT_40662 [Sphaerobolus stellatus SS14]|nr:hypothetical protein M422DRAFT_40662 [Sphaerobolus stellatus SS14]
MDLLGFDGALGVLCLTHKYQMDQLRLIVINLLQKKWLLEHAGYVFIRPIFDAKERNYQCIKLIDAARLTGSYQLFPPAAFELVRGKYAELVDGVGGAEILSSQDRRYLTMEKASWLRGIRTLEDAGGYTTNKASFWEHGLPSNRQISIFRLRTEVGAQAQKEEVSFCLNLFTTLRTLVGGALLDGKSIPMPLSLYCRMKIISRHRVPVKAARPG